MNAPPFFFSGGPWSQPPPPFVLNPNLILQNSLNLYTYLSNLAFTPHYHPALLPNNFPIQNPSFAPKHFPCPAFRPPPQPPSQNRKQLLLERIDRAVETARADLIAAGEGVSAWKVSQLAIRKLEVDCWSSLGFQMQQVPSLHRLMLTEGKINAFIHCFVGVRRIASLYDLEVAICKNEGVEQFEELGLGPLLQNPLVLHYFSVKCDATEVYKITSEDVISLLSEFMNTFRHTYIRVEEFLDFIVKKCTVASKEDLGIRIHSLGMHISAIRVARDLESAALKKSGELTIQKPDSSSTKRPWRTQQKEHFTTSIRKLFCGKHIRFDSESEGSDDEFNDHVRSNQVNLPSQSDKSSDRLDSENGLVVSPSQSKGPLNQVNLSSQSAESSDRMNIDGGLVISPSQSKGPHPSLKLQQDKSFGTICHRVATFCSIHKQFCGKHIRFDSADDSEDEGSDDDFLDEEENNSDQVICSVVNLSSQSGGRSDRVSTCPYPSAMEEMQRLGLEQPSPDSGSQKHKETIDSVQKKRKPENLASTISLPPKLRKTEKVELVARPIETGRQADNVRNLDRNKVECWPPVDWRTAPRYDCASANGLRTQAPNLQPRSDIQMEDNSYDRCVKQMDTRIPITDTPQWGSSNSGKRDRLSTCTPDAIQAKETGRLGEIAAFKYFVEKAGRSAVKWVNEHSETRLPYDIVVGENEDSKEFIEVKATRNPTKDWFEMSVRQLQFAVEQGEAFKIAHVILSDNNAATVRVYSNLEKLLMKHNNQEPREQDCKLKLVVLVLEPQKEYTIVS
ncbi:protein NO VEIN-LIKE [Argentina anserina]|uniref:protein NO VEIN-LIKE n=1 Tax=Argentina anserina TaxID=57926 RepID=UPI00217639EE|nr:protein NO VEIN-LIKE [Potentilla anserina]